MAQADAVRLPPPPTVLDSADMRVQELMYGHRFMQEQEPFMIVLETLAVCASAPLGSVVPRPDAHEAFEYHLPHRRKMRFLLFQDRHLDQVIEDGAIPDHEKWQEWKHRINGQFAEGTFSGGGPRHDAFAYLDGRFERDIRRLHQAVRLLKSRELDVMHNRRWTSRFLAVTGRDMVCTDMREVRNSWSIDRRFFGRGGELVYLMLNRSRLARDLRTLIDRRLLSETDPMNQIAQALSDPADTGAATTHVGYLPHLAHPAYDRLADDWWTVLTCNRLPDGHLFEPLFRVTGLNLVVYLAERAQAEMGAPRRMPIVVDLTDGGNQQLREEAKVHLNLHRDAANRAVQAFVERTLAESEHWQMAQQRVDPGLAKRAIRETFGYAKALDDAGGPSTPDRYLEAFVAQATRRDKNNAHKYLLALTKGSGLATSRQRIGPWFALDDGMLVALVLANVQRTVELREFVASLYRRYGLVIGPEEARDAFGRIHVERYEANLAALEARMARLSLTQRLSDDCAFVNNPYRAG
jgi:hypothetical protein